MTDGTPFFSIVVPTRSRPGILARALTSIADQTCTDFEVIVVDDSAGHDADAAMTDLAREFSGRFAFHRRSADGPHGAAVARNAGAAHARGAFITFLDDDDYWRDRRHLEIARTCLEARPKADMFIVNQVALKGETTVVACWLPHLDRAIAERPRVGDTECYELQRSDFVHGEGIGFPHVNMCIIRRALFESIGGFWDEVPNEEDLDLFLRLISAADSFLYRPATASVHTIPDTASTSWSDDEQNYRKRALTCEHAALHCAHPIVRNHANALRAGALKTIAKRRLAARDFRRASDFAAQAVAIDPSIKWRVISAALKVRSTISGPQ